MENIRLVENEIVSKKTREIINEYLLYLDSGNRSKQTTLKYSYVLEDFFGAVDKAINELDAEDVLEYIYTGLKGLKDTTISGVLSSLSAFFKYCQKKGYIEKEKKLIKKRWKPKLKKALPRSITESNFAKLRVYIQTLPLRDRLLVELTYATACRVGELQKIDVEDIDLENRTISITGKGNIMRKANFDVTCQFLLDEYLKNHPTEKKPTPLFLSNRNKRLSKRAISHIFKKISEDLGIKLTPHMLRHTRATAQYEQGAPINYIKNFLGHKSISTTLIYTKIGIKRLDKLYRKCME
ncbi:tyrosine-type recombinase/integrase [Proteinivorax hydrogeniformans]|uniref:Tyrosine-type recombinase/integrase n=1 Tax=Proteinivorax hydrogeniformans TaxID=1826727 RepID=A0AAU8HPU3_9FIRM